MGRMALAAAGGPDRFLDLLMHNDAAWKLVLALLCLLGLLWAVRSVLYMRKKRWEVMCFLILALLLLVWAGLLLLHYFVPQETLSARIFTLHQLAEVFVPALMCFHIWLQVYYKELTLARVLAFLSVPTLLSVFILIQTVQQPAAQTPFLRQGWGMVVYLLYTLFMLGSSYQLCFNTLYQTPARMRRSAGYLAVGLTVYGIFLAGDCFLTLLPDYDFTLVGLGVAMYAFNGALLSISSANVIATSRDFVFGSLSTMILVLSRSQRILDWNQKTVAGVLPEPHYRESFEHYHGRLLREAGGTVAAQSKNLITLTQNGTEYHYLITTNDIENAQRKFGHLVEISEVTKLYDIMRVLEDVAMVDQLTGLYNRNAYQSTVKRFVEEKALPMAVVVGDVNGLKRLNDNNGHLVGDALLVAVSDIISKAAPSGSSAFRIGGDEFVVLMPGMTLPEAEGFIQEADARCAEMDDERFGTPGVSWGYALMEEPTQDYNEVFREADAMMYAIKKTTFHFTTPGVVPSFEPAEDAPAEAQEDPPEDLPEAAPKAPTAAEADL